MGNEVDCGTALTCFAVLRSWLPEAGCTVAPATPARPATLKECRPVSVSSVSVEGLGSLPVSFQLSTSCIGIAVLWLGTSRRAKVCQHQQFVYPILAICKPVRCTLPISPSLPDAWPVICCGGKGDGKKEMTWQGNGKVIQGLFGWQRRENQYIRVAKVAHERQCCNVCVL